MKLSQRKLFLHREFTLNKESLNIKSRDLTSSEEFNIPYEEIDTSKIISRKQTDNIMLIITLIFGLFFMINILNPENYKGEGLLGVAIFLFVATLISGLITYIKSKNSILIPTMNNRYLEIFKGKPNSEQFDKFIKELSNEINSYLLQKYGTIDLDMPTEPQLMNLSWLKERKIITANEFEDLKSRLINNGTGNNPVGFKK